MTAAKRVAGWILRLIPERLLARLLPPAFRFDPHQLPEPPLATGAPVRLWIAPVNYAGQGYQWARAAQRHIKDVDATNMVVRVGGDFRHPADEVVPLGYYAASRRWQRREFDAVAGGFTHVIVEAERQPFGALLDETTEDQVDRLRQLGVSVAMLCHGTDIRLPSRHAENHPSSPFPDMDPALVRRLEDTALANRALLDRLDLPVLVSTPDLLADVPYAQWLPVIVDVDKWTTEVEPLNRAVPVVVHAPSSGPMKGSGAIDPVLQRMQDEGIIEYRRLQHVPFEAMFDAYRSADIVIDQLRIASYGVAACEAMAAGRVVIAHVSAAARAEVRERSGLELPIIDATATDLETVVRGIVQDRDAVRDLAGSGPRFVRGLHDGTSSAEVLRAFLATPVDRSAGTLGR